MHSTQVYKPADDSYFFAEFLEKYLLKQKQKNKDLQYLDMGTGSGILSITASKFISIENILAADINPKSMKVVREKGIKSIKSNLFNKINGKFDLITFNSPYLPRDSKEPKDSRISTTGGIKGDEISIKFLKQAKKHLNKNGKIFLLISSLTPKDKIKKFSPKTVAKRKIFFEELKILEFS